VHPSERSPRKACQVHNSRQHQFGEGHAYDRALQITSNHARSEGDHQYKRENGPGGEYEEECRYPSRRQ
jgi:hypothetical protein